MVVVKTYGQIGPVRVESPGTTPERVVRNADVPVLVGDIE